MVLNRRWLIVGIVALCISAGCAQNGAQNSGPKQQSNPGQTKIRTQAATPDLANGPERNMRDYHPLSLAQLHQKYPTTFVLNGPVRQRRVALTFDDAPDANFTPQVLDALKRKGVRATFFVVGNRAKAHPEMIKRMVQEGHAIGNHSYSHANLPKLSDAKFRQEIMRTDNVVRYFTGGPTLMVRPPYGNINETQIRWLASQHKKIVNWNVDSLDWKGLNAEQVETNVLAHVRTGSIVLQHAAGGQGEDLSGTVKALPAIIDKLRKDGVKLVTVPELLGIQTRK